jgi:uncharacterized protein YraI
MTSLPRLIAPMVLAAGLTIGATAVALAAPGIALANANVRTGPGLGYGVVDQLNVGERVIVIDCGGNWCLVHHIGPDGWVRRSLLVNPYYPTHPYNFPPKNPNEPGRGPLVGRSIG